MHRIIACLLLSTGLAAQTSSLVVPPKFTATPGNSLDQQPLGRDRIRHMQFVARSYLTGMGTAATITGINYRREENRLDQIYSNYEPMRRTVNAAIPIPNWQIRMGNWAGRMGNLVPEYEGRPNATTWTTVFAGQLDYNANTPTLSAPPSPSNPAPFGIKFPFNVQGFSYVGGGLAVEHFAYGGRNLNHIYYVDAVETQQAGGDVDLISAQSLGCPSGQNRVYGSAPNPGAGDLTLQLFGAPPSTSSLCWFGVSDTNWNGAPLPLNLGFMGLASCEIHCDWRVPVALPTDAAGIAEYRVAVPAQASLAGFSLFNQWAVLDQRVNPTTGFATSDGVKITLGASLGVDTVNMAVISGENGLANNRYGFLQRGRGAVFQLLY